MPTVGGNNISVYFDRAVINLAALFIYLTNIKLSGIIVITSLQGTCQIQPLAALHILYKV